MVSFGFGWSLNVVCGEGFRPEPHVM